MNGNPNEPQALGICKLCAKPTTKLCQKCKEGAQGDLEHHQTYYCGKECQTIDWKSHKSICKSHRQRKQLYNAGRFVQQMFYVYRENVFDIEISKIETQDGKTLIWEGKYQRGQIMAKYPKDLVKDESTKQVVLTYLTCSDAVHLMEKITRTCLQGKSIVLVAVEHH